MRSIFGCTFALIAVSTSFVAACSGTQATIGAESEATPGGKETDGPNIVAAVSGTRLRAKYLTTADGARQFVGWYDSQLKQDCHFDLAEDMKLRCLPLATLANVSGFTDAACTKAAAFLANTSGGRGTPPVVPSCAPVAVYSEIYPTDGNSCGTALPGRQIRTVTKVAANAPFYGNNGGTGSACSAQSQAGLGTFYAASDPIPATSFVEGTASTQSVGNLIAKFVVGSDGTREHVGWSTPSFGDCTFQLMADGATRCIPIAAVSGTQIYADALCLGAPVAVELEGGTVTGPCAPAPPTMWLSRDDSKGMCIPTGGVFSVVSGGSAPSSAFEVQYDGMCMSQSFSYGSANVARIGGEMTATLPTTARIGTGGSQRLVPALVAMEGVRDLVTGWHDTVKNVDCAFAVASDGKTRCLPVAGEADVLFRDGACKGPAMVAGLSSTTCDANGGQYGLVTSTGTCPATVTVYALAATAETLTVASVLAAPGSCGQLAGATNVYGATLVPPTDFMEAVATTE